MVETVGRRLQKARQERKLTIDEVAAATKIRPERIVDLEADDLTHFPSLVYARSFLVKYARFLGLDIQDDLENFQVNRAVGFGEFKYLTAAPPPKFKPEPRFNQPKKSLAPPLILAVIAAIILIGVPLIAFFAVNLSRLSPGEEEQYKTVGTTPTPRVQQSATPLTEKSPLAATTPEPLRQPLTSPTVPAQVTTNAQTPASLSPTPQGTVEVRRALPVTAADKESATASPSASASASVAASASPSAPPSQKLEIKVKERTWLRVTKDRENSEPVFNDFIGPNSPAIVIQGKRFWLKALDKTALELRKNGQAVNGQDGDIVIE
ncbi:MAG TPA: helix-turn-helix domain-containing protein [Chthoniobacterales bacterium]|nr:helix-turn-helix domain-containing protein [Chthoniobacterales bacterium]